MKKKGRREEGKKGRREEELNRQHIFD